MIFMICVVWAGLIFSMPQYVPPPSQEAKWTALYEGQKTETNKKTKNEDTFNNEKNEDCGQYLLLFICVIIK